MQEHFSPTTFNTCVHHLIASYYNQPLFASWRKTALFDQAKKEQEIPHQEGVCFFLEAFLNNISSTMFLTMRIILI